MAQKLHLNLKKILTDRADVLSQKSAIDSAGQKSTQITNPDVLAAAQACRLIPMKGFRENTTDTRLSVTRYNVFIMPIVGVEITEHLWLRINGRYYNILSAPPALMDGAPIELVVEEVRP